MFICKPRYKCGVVANENTPAHADNISVAVSTDTMSNAKYDSLRIVTPPLSASGRRFRVHLLPVGVDTRAR
jgi:hypothetical protein